MTFYDHLLTRPEFERQPPVLVDVGAAGFLQPQWRHIARHSIYVGFDADDRELDYLPRLRPRFKGFHIVRAVVAEADDTTGFHFTQSPQCSSTLLPDSTALADWSFSPLFEVKHSISAPSVRLDVALRDLSLDYVDWFKTDSQGTDLRLLRSLGPDVLKRLIAAELEPGIEDAYHGEDKMHAVMAFMDTQPFWLNALTVKGPQRIRRGTLEKYFTRLERRFFHYLHPSAAFYGEMEYLNTFSDPAVHSSRHILFGWIVSSIKRQHGFALEVAILGHRLHGEPIYKELQARSIASLRRNRALLPVRLFMAAWRAACRKFNG